MKGTIYLDYYWTEFTAISNASILMEYNGPKSIPKYEVVKIIRNFLEKNIY